MNADENRPFQAAAVGKFDWAEIPTRLQVTMAVLCLLFVALFRARARRAGIKEVTIAGRNVRFAPVVLPDSRVVRLQRLYPKSIAKPQVETLLVPRPQTAVVGGQPIHGMALLEWARGVIDAVIDPKES